MILNHKVFGSSNNKIIILHGLLGSLDNWVTVAKNLASHGFEIILIDQRNHGKSFHADQFDYETMSEDLKNFLDEKKIQKVSLIGHSMGGKTIMNFILNYPSYANKVIVVDILPKAYNNDYEKIFNAFSKMDLNNLKSRKQIDEYFSGFFSESPLRAAATVEELESHFPNTRCLQPCAKSPCGAICNMCNM